MVDTSQVASSASAVEPTLRLVAERAVAAPSRSDEAYVALRHRILTLQLPPGHGFSETEVCELLELSKAPVRDALARLRRDGLVVSAARSGYTVAPVTVKDARDLFALRTLLEAESAALAAARGGDLDRLRELDALCLMHYDPADAESIQRFLAVNSSFHLAVAELGGNQRLTHQLARAIDQLERYMHLGLRLCSRAEDIVHEHRELVAAIAAGNVRLARTVAERQARESHRMVLDGLLSSDAVLTANIGSGMGGG